MAEKPEDLTLPVASVNRVINEAIPDNVNVSGETRKTISKAASVFILFTTATAAAAAQKAGRKTINANDVLEAIEEMDFPQFKEPLESFLENFKDSQKKKKESTSAKKQSTGGGSEKKSSGGNNSSVDKNNSGDAAVVTLSDSE